MTEIPDEVASKSTLRQTMRLSLSELDQLMTSFSYCYDNEMRPWCASPDSDKDHLVAGRAIGPTLKRINAPLEQFVNVSCFILDEVSLSCIYSLSGWESRCCPSD